MSDDNEELMVMEDVLRPEKTYSIYTRFGPDGHRWSVGTAPEPRETLLDRSRGIWEGAYRADFNLRYGVTA